MAVKISGVLKDGAGKPVQNCTIQLKAKRNSTTVVANTVASENPDEAGRYSMDVEYGQYSVILLVEGFPKPIKLGRSSRWYKSEVEQWK
ncbi:TPA: phage tail protein [Escherichia coli]|nr:phage tail protein [Escherichia coli]